uniref:Uncharacterized protein n=1 Tax=Avena sativa TaxID=4498 RepID=A0ACD5XF33_AVESA
MAEAGALFSLSAAAVVEDVLREHGCRLSDRDLASRRTGEAAARRNEAAGWLRRAVGAVAGRDLPEEPSEEEFRLGLRNGQILCSALNRVHPGAVQKVVTADSVDGAALSAFQYFENVRNFLVAAQDIGLPCFEASDLEQGGKSARVVNCVLALKSYGDWKQCGGTGLWKFGGNLKPSASGKSLVRKNSEPFRRCQSMNEGEAPYEEAGFNADAHLDHADMSRSRPLKMLVSAVLSDKRPDEVPKLLESMLSKLVDEFENRLNTQNDLNRAVGSTALNDRSSRSHSCLTVHVQGKDLTSGNIIRGCMHLVDLAGSERVDKSEVTGERLKEAQHINKSLSALGDVIASLAQKNAHVPYRNSKLTQLLQDSLGGQAKTLMFVHISPESDAVGETISTLKFSYNHVWKN